MANINLDDLEKLQHLLFGYKKNGRPRAVWDIVTEGAGITEKCKNKKKKRHGKKKKHSKHSQDLFDFYDQAFNIKKMDW